MLLEIVRNDITKMRVDAIVNTANPRPIVGGGVDRAIHQAAGEELLATRKKIGDIATGKAEITPAYNLHAKFVIHTVGPMRQNYAVNKDAIYGIGENRGAWVIQLISEELPGYFKATYLDEKTADGKADNKAIHDWLMKEMAARAK